MKRWVTVLLLAACGRETPVPRVDPAPAVAVAIAADAAVAPAADPGFVAVIAAIESVDVAPPFDGTLVAVHARPGDRVTSGQILAEIDPVPLREELVVAQASLRAAQASARQAAVDVRDAQREVASATRAVADGVSPRHELDQARFALERAQAARARAAATVAEAQARVERARSRLSETSVRAPFAGTVAVRLRDRGASVGPRAPVVRLLGQGGLRVRFAVPPEDARRFAPGDPVRVAIEGVQGDVSAAVRHIAPEIDAPSRLVFVEAELAAMEEALQPGLPARVWRR